MYQGSLIVCDSPETIKTMTTGERIALWPSDVRQAQEVVGKLDGILEVQIYGDQLRLFVDESEDVDRRIKTALSDAGIDILAMCRTWPRMEEAFITLVWRQIRESKEESHDMEKAA